MGWKKIGKALLFPHLVILFILLPVATVLLVYAMVLLESESVIAVISYVIAAYTLIIWCVRVPEMVCNFKKFKNENKYARRWLEDAHLRVNVSLYSSLLWNVAYALLQLGLGFWHHTFWFYSLAGYYSCLAVMRFFLVLHTSKNKAGEKMQEELKRYRNCGIVFLFMNLVLSFIVFFMVYYGRTFEHHEITTIAMAAYTFSSMTMAIINVVKYRKYNSPVYSATKSISLAAACVSMLTLESTMLTTFGTGTMAERKMLGATGTLMCAFIITMAIYMIVQSNKKLRLHRKEFLNGK